MMNENIERQRVEENEAKSSSFDITIQKVSKNDYMFHRNQAWAEQREKNIRDKQVKRMHEGTEELTFKPKIKNMFTANRSVSPHIVKPAAKRQ